MVDVRRDALARLRVDVVDDQMRALFTEQFGDPGADARASAGDDDGLIC